MGLSLAQFGAYLPEDEYEDHPENGDEIVLDENQVPHAR